MDDTEFSERAGTTETGDPGSGAATTADTGPTETDEAAGIVERAEAGDEAAELALGEAGGGAPDEGEAAAEPITEEPAVESAAEVDRTMAPEPADAVGADVTDVPTEEATVYEGEAEAGLAADTVEGEDEGALVGTGPDAYVTPAAPETVDLPADAAPQDAGPAAAPVEEPEPADSPGARLEERGPTAASDAEEPEPAASAEPHGWTEPAGAAVVPEAGPDPELSTEAAADDASGEDDRRAAVEGPAPAVAVEEPEDEEAARSLFRGPGEWYVIHTYAGYENKVKANLNSRIGSMQMEDKIFDVVIPMEDVMEIKGGKKQVVQKKVFPGYLLVKMVYDNDSWYVVRNTPGVTGFVSSGTGTKPTPLSQREVEKILAVKQETKVKPQYRLEWEEGDVVRIVAGPFADFTGTIAEINVEQSKLKVMVNIFDRETPVELAFDQVAKA